MSKDHSKEALKKAYTMSQIGLTKHLKDFEQEDEPREEVREKNKHKNHKGRDDR